MIDQNAAHGMKRMLVICLTGLSFACAASVLAQNNQNAPPTNSVAPRDVASDSVIPAADNLNLNSNTASSPQPTEAPALKDPQTYDHWVLAPAMAAILLAILMRSVVPALAIGVLVGAYMMIPCLDPASRLSDIGAIAGVRIAVEKYVLGSLLDDGARGRQTIILFTLIIGGMVGCISANGGTRALVNRIARFASTSRRGQLTGWFAGLVVFFDDYANSMIVGPTLRPMFDRLRISRAKLAYIVDSTAAPVASIALLGTWLGAELEYIQDGLNTLAASGGPAFLSEADSMSIFVQTIPYRFYPILALWMVFVIALTCRDFGPMRRAESAALSGADPNIRRRDAEDSDTLATSGWLAAIPILVLVGVTVAVMYQTGAAKVDPVVGADGDYLATLRDILKEADTYSGILYGAIASLTVALLLTFISRACSIRDAMDGALDGMSRMFPAIVVLVLAWSLSSVSQDLKMGQVATRYLTEWNLPAEWLPLVVFAIAAIVSFATGSSWTTMGILTPVVVEVAARLAGAGPEADAINLFYAAVGSVLAGSIFGDHCSPISDTTVLSSVATGCRVEDHVWTQMPYALVVAIVGMGAGNYYCMHYDQPPWVGLAIGAGALLFIVLLIGRNPRPSDMLQPPSRDRLETRLRAQTQQASESAARPPAPQPPRGGSGLV